MPPDHPRNAIPFQDAQVRRADFHALRHTLTTILANTVVE